MLNSPGKTPRRVHETSRGVGGSDGPGDEEGGVGGVEVLVGYRVEVEEVRMEVVGWNCGLRVGARSTFSLLQRRGV